MIQHPTLEELSGYVHGTLPEEAAETVAEHVAGCENCDTLVSQLERDPDQFLQAIRVPDTHEMAEVDPVCQQVLVRIQQVGLDVTVELNAPQAAPSAAPPPLGQIGPYRLLEKLGQGGMGTVYKALHIKLDKLVALKVLSADRMQDPQAVSRFEREMKAVGKLEHPHLIRAFDAGEAEGTHFLVMEYVAGEDLGSLAKRLGQLPVAEACELIRQAAVGLQYAHEHGLVHRDIKPANLLVAFSGQLSAVSSQEDATGIPKLNADRCPLTATLKILDLGFALLQEQAGDAGELTSAGQVMGTLDYMAPEQCGDSHQVDIRADIYSLGATLYRLLAGRARSATGNTNPRRRKSPP